MYRRRGRRVAADWLRHHPVRLLPEVNTTWGKRGGFSATLRLPVGRRDADSARISALFEESLCWPVAWPTASLSRVRTIIVVARHLAAERGAGGDSERRQRGRLRRRDPDCDLTTRIGSMLDLGTLA